MLASCETADRPAEFEVHFHYPAGDAGGETAADEARVRMVEMIRVDSELSFIDDFDGKGCSGLVVWNCSGERADALLEEQAASGAFDEDDENFDSDLPPLELDRDLLMPMVPPSGPLELNLPGQNDLAPNQPTRVFTLGLDPAPGGWSATVYFDRECADLERARYWASKQERLSKENGYRACTSVFYQTPVTPESVISEVLAVLNAKP
jgi:hypothetical protein